MIEGVTWGWTVTKKVASLLVVSFLIITQFQNCGEAVKFSNHPGAADVLASDLENPDNNGDGDTPPKKVCNPLNPSEACDHHDGEGLIGKLYYLTPEIHGALFNNDLNNAKINDYAQFGIKVPVDIIMTSVNVTPRSWENGFYISKDEQVEKENGEKLFEWFHLDLKGYISLPAGSYEFGTRSDDGIRVTIDEAVIIDHDGVHPPSFKCSNRAVTFAAGEKKLLRVQYFQGPRNQIAMQLLVRSSNKIGDTCSLAGGLEEIEAAAYSSKK